jgi:two-component system, LytTR family, response regulator
MTEDKKLKALIVDDEPIACRRIQRMLADDPEIQVVATSTNGEQALQAIQQFAPDLLFLDIQMPGMNGFALLEHIAPEKIPHVIFVTAYDQYALRAFEVHALDYLLKPFDRERFAAAVSRAKIHIEKDRSTQINRGILSLLKEFNTKAEYVKRLVIKTNGRIFFLKTDEIDWIEAEGKYVYLHVGKDAHLMRQSISGLETELDPDKFIRIHRSAIVNVERIQELQPWFHGEYRVLLRNGTQLMLSRSHREKLQSLLGL